jgi:hypothetical protein
MQENALSVCEHFYVCGNVKDVCDNAYNVRMCVFVCMCVCVCACVGTLFVTDAKCVCVGGGVIKSEWAVIHLYSHSKVLIQSQWSS